MDRCSFTSWLVQSATWRWFIPSPTWAWGRRVGSESEISPSALLGFWALLGQLSCSVKTAFSSSSSSCVLSSSSWPLSLSSAFQFSVFWFVQCQGKGAGLDSRLTNQSWGFCTLSWSYWECWCLDLGWILPALFCMHYHSLGWLKDVLCGWLLPGIVCPAVWCYLCSFYTEQINDIVVTTTDSQDANQISIQEQKTISERVKPWTELTAKGTKHTAGQSLGSAEHKTLNSKL